MVSRAALCPPLLYAVIQALACYLHFNTGVLNLFCILYPFPIEKNIIHPERNTSTFLILKIEVCFSLYIKNFTPSSGKIDPQGVNLPLVKNPCLNISKKLVANYASITKLKMIIQKIQYHEQGIV